MRIFNESTLAAIAYGFNKKDEEKRRLDLSEDISHLLLMTWSL